MTEACFCRADADAKQEELRLMVGYVLIAPRGCCRSKSYAESAGNGIATSCKRRPR